MDAPYNEMSKAKLDEALHNLESQGVELDCLKGPFQPKPYHDALISSSEDPPHRNTLHHSPSALTSGVHLGEIIEDAGAGTVGLDQITGLQGYSPDKILSGWVFL